MSAAAAVTAAPTAHCATAPTVGVTATPPAAVRELLLEVARPSDTLLNMASADAWMPPLRRVTHGYPPYADQEFSIVYVEMPSEHDLLRARRAVRRGGVLVFCAIGSVEQHRQLLFAADFVNSRLDAHGLWVAGLAWPWRAPLPPEPADDPPPPPPMDSATFFDSRTHDVHTKPWAGNSLAKAQIILDNLPRQEHVCVVDLAGGGYVDVDKYARAAAGAVSYLCIDQVESALQRGAAKPNRAHASTHICADMRDLMAAYTLPREQFADIVSCQLAAHLFLHCRDDVRSFGALLRRIVKPGGRVLLSVPEYPTVPLRGPLFEVQPFESQDEFPRVVFSMRGFGQGLLESVLPVKELPGLLGLRARDVASFHAVAEFAARRSPQLLHAFKVRWPPPHAEALLMKSYTMLVLQA